MTHGTEEVRHDISEGGGGHLRYVVNLRACVHIEGYKKKSGKEKDRRDILALVTPIWDIKPKSGFSQVARGSLFIFSAPCKIWMLSVALPAVVLPSLSRKKRLLPMKFVAPKSKSTKHNHGVFFSFLFFFWGHGALY